MNDRRKSDKPAQPDDFVSVLSFGAVGDGETDNSFAFKKALESVSDMTWAQCIARSADPFKTSQSQYIKTGGDAHYTWYMFQDGSQLQFDVTNRLVRP